MKHLVHEETSMQVLFFNSTFFCYHFEFGSFISSDGYSAVVDRRARENEETYNFKRPQLSRAFLPSKWANHSRCRSYAENNTKPLSDRLTASGGRFLQPSRHLLLDFFLFKSICVARVSNSWRHSSFWIFSLRYVFMFHFSLQRIKCEKSRHGSSISMSEPILAQHREKSGWNFSHSHAKSHGQRKWGYVYHPWPRHKHQNVARNILQTRDDCPGQPR